MLENVENIVSVEVKDNGDVEIFKQDENGGIYSEHDTHKFWVLSDRNLNGNGRKLTGNLHYSWGWGFKTKKEFGAFNGYYNRADRYTIWNEKENYMVRNNLTYFVNLKQKDVSVFSFDLETTSLAHDESAKILLISTYYRDKHGVKNRLFSFDEWRDEKTMLLAFSQYLYELNPSILLGHNIVCYDIPYMDYCAKRAGIELQWGRNGSSLTISKKESKFRKDRSQFIHYNKSFVYGREIVDTMFMSIKYDVKRRYPNFRLKDIVAFEKLEADNRVFYDASQIRHNYKNPVEFEKIKAYCEFDAEDAVKLWDLMGGLFFVQSAEVPKPFQMVIESASGSQLNAMSVAHYLSQLHSIPKADETFKYEGAISYGRPGIYRNVNKVDAKSLYPSIMMTYDVFPKHKDPLGFIESSMKDAMTSRLKLKALYQETGDKLYDIQDSVLKGRLNSYYGAYGAPGLNFNFPKGAARVTEHGRNILLECIHWATGEDYTQRLKDEGETSDDDATEDSSRFYSNKLRH